MAARHAIEEAPLTTLFACLCPNRGLLASASQRSADDIGVGLPPTIVFEHNIPKLHCYSDARGVLQRRSGRDMDSRHVVDIITPNSIPDTRLANLVSRHPAGSASSPHPIVAVYVEPHHDDDRGPAQPSRATADGAATGGAVAKRSATPTGANRGPPAALPAPRYEVQYLTKAGLHYFLHAVNKKGGADRPGGGAASLPFAEGIPDNDPSTAQVRPIANKRGVLQRFVHSGTAHHEVLMVTWSPHLFLCEKLRNDGNLNAADKPLYDRAATFDGPMNVGRRQFVSPTVAGKLEKATELIVRKLLHATEGLAPKHLQLWFKLDQQHQPWLLWCPCLELQHRGHRGGVPRRLSGSSDGNAAHKKPPRAFAQAKRFVDDLREQAEGAAAIDTSFRPLTLVQWSQADADRAAMLLASRTALDNVEENDTVQHHRSGGQKREGNEGPNMTLAASASRRGMPPRPGTSSGGRPASRGAKPPAVSGINRPLTPTESAMLADATKRVPEYAVPSAAKAALLQGTTRSAHHAFARVQWSQIAPSPSLALDSGLAAARNREDMERVDLDAKCFHTQPLRLRCLDADTDDGHVDVAKSRLMPRMSWREGRDGRRTPLTTEFDNSSVRRRNRGLQQKGHSATRAQQRRSPSPHRTDGGADAADTKVDDVVSVRMSHSRALYASFNLPEPGADAALRPVHVASPALVPAQPPAAESDGEYALQCAAAADGPRGDSTGTRVGRVQLIARSIEHGVDWLRGLLRVGRAHFRCYPRRALAVSVPTVLFPSFDVYLALVAALREGPAAHVEAIPVEPAVALDRAVHREGVVDEYSYHHADGFRAAPLASSATGVATTLATSSDDPGAGRDAPPPSPPAAVDPAEDEVADGAVFCLVDLAALNWFHRTVVGDVADGRWVRLLEEATAAQ